MADSGGEHPFAAFIRTLGRGPGRSRALTRDEARDALTVILAGEAEPHQVGAFLMLLRYRGEDPEEVAGLVEAARAAIPGTSEPIAVDLDWPSYGAGRTRGAPWFLLAALALARAGYRILMHGSNEFSAGTPVADALSALGIAAARDRADAGRKIAQEGFAYLPLAAFHPQLDHLLGLRRLLGLRSPINTVARLLDPLDAAASVDGVFHPPYISLHLAVAARLGRPRLLVVKGGGGEAERNPAKAMIAHLHASGSEPRELALPTRPPASTEIGEVLETWHGPETRGTGAVIARATIALALLAMNRTETPSQADALADAVWEERLTKTAI